MNIFDALEKGVTSVIAQLGLSIQIPGVILGLALVLMSIYFIRREAGSEPSLGPRIASGVMLPLGISIILSSIGVGIHDALLCGLFALLFSSFWLTAAPGRLITVIGLVAALVTIGGIVYTTEVAPDDSIMAQSVETVQQWLGRFGASVTHSK